MHISAAIYSAISYVNCVVVKSQKAVVVLIGRGSELEPAKRGEVLSGNVDRPRTAAEIVRDREGINIRAVRGHRFRRQPIPSRGQIYRFHGDRTSRRRPWWNYVSYALGPRILRAACQLFIREPF